MIWTADFALRRSKTMLDFFRDSYVHLAVFIVPSIL
jgi:hypothetical protein